MRRLRTALLILFVPLALILGVWLGGHPDFLPGFARETLVADSDGRLYEEAVDKIDATYYREIDRDELLNTSLEQAVESLDDQFSHYFSPKEYHAFQLDTEGAFEGVGMSVTTVPEGLREQEVYDDGEGFDWVPRRADAGNARGWGLHFTDAVASRWAIERGERNCVWFELDRP